MEEHCFIGLSGKVKEHIRTLQSNTRNTLPQSTINAVVFYGYSSGLSIKDHEHERMKGKSATDIKLCETMTAHSKQHKFLANDRNKTQFIDLLKQHLSRDGHNVKQSENDADTLIVKSALDFA